MAAVLAAYGSSQLQAQEAAVQDAELTWLLARLQEALAALKDGLQECVTLLAPKESGSTLVVSTSRSEQIKGFVTRQGTSIIKGVGISRSSSTDPKDIQLRLATLVAPRGLSAYPIKISDRTPLPQLVSLRDSLARALDVVDVSRWTGDPQNASFIAGMLQLLHEAVEEARQTLGLEGDAHTSVWSTDPGVNPEPLLDSGPTVAVHLSIQDAAVVLHVRTLEPAGEQASFSGLSIRSKLGLLARYPTHDEMDQTFQYRDHAVRVREKLRVESQDPSLMAVLAKLSALAHSVAAWRLKLRQVMEQAAE